MIVEIREICAVTGFPQPRCGAAAEITVLRDHDSPRACPTRKDLARASLGVIFCSVALVFLWIEAFWRPGAGIEPLGTPATPSGFSK
jgi:hypothetical protein